MKNFPNVLHLSFNFGGGKFSTADLHKHLFIVSSFVKIGSGTAFLLWGRKLN